MPNVFVLTLAALLLLPVQARALSLDAAALSSDLTRQAQVNLVHIHETENATIEVGGKWAKTAGRPQLYEIYKADEFRFPYQIRVTADVRRLQSHDTYSGGIGTGRKAFTLTAGVRVEYKGFRDTFGNLLATVKANRGWLALTSSVEGLHNSDKGRIDYRATAKAQGRFLYVAFRVERVRDVALQGVSLGVKL